jgi:hypothetical protein
MTGTRRLLWVTISLLSTFILFGLSFAAFAVGRGDWVAFFQSRVRVGAFVVTLSGRLARPEAILTSNAARHVVLNGKETRPPAKRSSPSLATRIGLHALCSARTAAVLPRRAMMVLCAYGTLPPAVTQSSEAPEASRNGRLGARATHAPAPAAAVGWRPWAWRDPGRRSCLCPA